MLNNIDWNLACIGRLKLDSKTKPSLNIMFGPLFVTMWNSRCKYCLCDFVTWKNNLGQQTFLISKTLWTIKSQVLQWRLGFRVVVVGSGFNQCYFFHVWFGYRLSNHSTSAVLSSNNLYDTAMFHFWFFFVIVLSENCRWPSRGCYWFIPWCIYDSQDGAR
jgi:hypothetical protein